MMMFFFIIMRNMDILFFRKSFQHPLVQTLHGPFIHRHSSDATVNLQGGLVPIEAYPLHAAAVTLHSKVGQVFQQGFAVASSATTSSAHFSYAASFLMKSRTSPASSGFAGRILKRFSIIMSLLTIYHHFTRGLVADANHVDAVRERKGLAGSLQRDDQTARHIIDIR